MCRAVAGAPSQLYNDDYQHDDDDDDDDGHSKVDWGPGARAGSSGAQFALHLKIY